MRRKDWADEQAELLFDMVRDGEDDDVVIERIGEALRRAANDGKALIARTHGPIGEEFE